ncbi:DUF4369 domain-containing protein [Nonlabens mediterrranea]|uniref:DUF4369 domain-containing protein n=1 Tax=Nonlabens mediterrranea TaxID=1419947 RepID=A0ABS0A9F9_9FLAO|nr:DUF4369 domain-containing protein [Nonlabens mediterrranea]
MKNTFIAIITLLILTSCGNDKSGNLIVNGTVDGLKIGKLYLQQLQDTTLVNVDSVIVDGEAPFQMSATIDEPQLMYLYLDKKDGTIYDDRLTFFAEDTIITINTTLDKFETSAIVSGSKNQKLYNEFNKINKQLSTRYTELFKRSMNLSQADVRDQDSIDALSTDINKHLKRKVGYALNFAMLNKDYEIAPFILLKEGYEANPVYLDSAYNMMPKKIQSSRYGKQLSEFIKERKEEL